MKKKFLYINLLILLFLSIVNFSPQGSSTLLPVVYAEEIESVLGTTNKDGTFVNGVSGDGFGTQLGDYLNGGTSGTQQDKEKMKNNMLSSVALISKTLASLTKTISGFALMLSVVIVAIIGFKVINSGQGNVLQFIKQKKEISNAIICILFILVIPYLVRTVLEFKPPSSLMTNMNSNVNGSVNLGDITTNPKSGLAEYIKKDVAADISSSTDKGFSLPDVGINEGDNVFTGLLKIVRGIILSIISSIIYAPLLLITSVLGSIGFYPVSLDPAMYMTGDGSVPAVIEAFFSLNSKSAVIDLGSNITSTVAGGLSNLTFALNVLYFVIKKFVMLCLELVCYYYGIMHLLNKDTSDVGKFLTRLAQGVIGMVLFPYMIEFMLDLDGLIAISIMRLTGISIPGFGILGLLPTVSDTLLGFTNLILAIIMAALVLSIAKAFFIRRIEISLLYVSSPAFFLKHMMSSKDDSVQKLFKRMSSSIFLTTTYAPLFAIISLLTSMGSSIDGEFGQMTYYLLIIGILWMGKGVISNIVSEFAGQSMAAGTARNQLESGISSAPKKALMGAALAGGAVIAGKTGANKLGSLYKSTTNGTLKNAIPNTLNKFKDGFVENGKLDGKKSLGTAWNGIKTVGKGAGKGIAAPYKYGANFAEAQFRDTRNSYENKYGKFMPGSLEDAIYHDEIKREDKKFQKEEERINAPFKREEDLFKQESDKVNSDYKRAIYKKYGVEKGQDKMSKYKKMVDKNFSQIDSFERFDEFLNTQGKSIKNDFKVGLDGKKPQELKSLEIIEETFKSTGELSVLKQNALNNGNIEEAKEFDIQIENNNKFIDKEMITLQKSVKNSEVHSERVAKYDELKAFAKSEIVTGVKPQYSVNGDLNKTLTTVSSNGDANTKTMVQDFNNFIEVNKDSNLSQPQLVNKFVNERINDVAKGSDNVNVGALNSIIDSVYSCDITTAKMHMQEIKTHNPNLDSSYAQQIDNFIANDNATTVDYMVLSKANPTAYKEAHKNVTKVAQSKVDKQESLLSKSNEKIRETHHNLANPEEHNATIIPAEKRVYIAPAIPNTNSSSNSSESMTSESAVDFNVNASNSREDKNDVNKDSASKSRPNNNAGSSTSKKDVTESKDINRETATMVNNNAKSKSKSPFGFDFNDRQRQLLGHIKPEDLVFKSFETGNNPSKDKDDNKKK